MRGVDGDRSRPVVYAAIGASDTLGEGADDPDNDSWVRVLHERLPSGSVLHRLGASGATAAEARDKLVPHAEQVRPDLATVWLAVNDFRHEVPLDEYEATLDEIVGRVTATGATVLVGNLPDLAGMPEFDDRDPDELRGTTRRWNEVIARVAGARGAVLVDIMAASDGLADERSYLLSEDRFHPSTLGHLALAEVFFHYYELSRDP